ncbi:zinc finger Y-chromosomal protein 1 isoform X2 [Eurytemora carolleeae]|nr:zinc finger Y-chromosomal protein 1 isoform X2 [Eurytemora carolleeae]XP_023321214.1 zinc finger Y-chromosomal protein 1 isoform X2 [Eurytemora carolleeae]|eukprot:XP_023321213.1 zinc finger Y-chromosomal protein 1-like isoform X2 [Eurytemora affinis]
MSLFSERLQASTHLQSIEAVIDDKRVLKHILTDILNLRNGMEDNLLLIQQINQKIQKEGEELSGFNDVIHAAQQHIDSIEQIYTLGVSWLKGETELAFILLQDEDYETKRDCEIKIEMEDIENTFYGESIEHVKNEEPSNFCPSVGVESTHTPEPVCVEPTDVLDIVCEESKETKVPEIKEEIDATKKNQERIYKEEETERKHQIRKARTVKSNLLRFSCTLCEYKSARKDNLNQHILVKHENVGYKCDQCDRTFTQMPSLKRHTIEIHSKQKLECNKCEFSTPRLEVLKLHEDSVHRGIRYPCDVCEYVGVGSLHLKRHMVLQHNETGITDERNVFPCSECDYVAGSTSYLRIHIKKHKETSSMCDQCDHIASNEGNLKIHIDNIHNKSVIYSCDQCEYKGYSKPALYLHRKRHSEHHLCDQCPYVGKLKANLKNHIRVVHEGLRFPCDLCNHMAISRGHLKTHKEAVHIGKKYPCDLCTFSASNKTNLKEHKACKHDDTKHPCDHCDHLASTQYALRKHIKSKH